MPRDKRYRTEVLRSAHQAAQDLHAIGAIDDAAMRRFDDTCLVDGGAKSLAKAKIEALRGEIGRGRESGPGIPARDVFAQARAGIAELKARKKG